MQKGRGGGGWKKGGRKGKGKGRGAKAGVKSSGGSYAPGGHGAGFKSTPKRKPGSSYRGGYQSTAKKGSPVKIKTETRSSWGPGTSTGRRPGLLGAPMSRGFLGGSLSYK